MNTNNTTGGTIAHWQNILLLLCLLLPAPSIVAREVTINEVMASNATTIADEDGDYEDWIELYNTGDTEIHLIGYGLSDDYDNPFRWVFPDITMQPGEFLLIWASGKNRSDPGQSLHTNFSISSAGEEVLITHPDGTRLDELAPASIPTDISYGRQPDGVGQWFYFANPTPGESNVSEGLTGLLDQPLFSAEGGFYTNELQLDISHPDPGVTIIYTTDGSDPCINNLEGTSYEYKNDYPYQPEEPFGDFLTHEFISKIFDGAILIADRSAEPDKLARISATVQPPVYMPDDPVPKATLIRARAFREGMLPSDIMTHTYFISPEGPGRFTLPVMAISVQENHLFDYQDGIYTPGVDADQWRMDNPGETFSWPFDGNFRRRGAEWEYPAHIELFEQPDGERAFAQDIGIRIHGGATRSFPMKSLRLYARNQYTNSHLTHAFFGDGMQAYKRLILRNSGNDFPTDLWRPDYPSRTMFRDAAIQAIVAHMHFDTQAYRPALLFINGEYWGIQNIRERYDKHFLHRNHGVDEENIDLLTGKDEVKEGDNLHYQATIAYIETYGLEDDAHYDHILTRIDEQNFIDYQIAHIYADNTDWPGNNVDFWRLRTGSFQPDAPHGHDGRWRWLLYDMDFGFGLVGDEEAYKHNTLAFATDPDGPGWPNPPWSTFLLRRFLENEKFRNQFINRFADQLNTAFLPERVVSVINTMKEAIEPEIEEHFTRWGYPDIYERWQEHVAVMNRFAENRPFYQRQHLKEQFGLDGLFNLKLDVSNPLMGHVRINTVDIKSGMPGVADFPYPWEGKYFLGVPVEVEAVPAPGYVFSHWEGASYPGSAVIVLDADQDIELTAHFEKTGEPVLMHYWLFDTRIPNDTPLETLDAFYGIVKGGRIEYHSSLAGYPFGEGHPFWRKASMERRNQPAAINYRPEGNKGIPYHQTDMRGLQIRQPFIHNDHQNTMIFHMPANGFREIVMRFAAKDEGAADQLLIDYQTGEDGGEWTTAGIINHELPLSHAYQLYETDFSHIAKVENNPHFKVRIRFDGENMQADDGDRVTFNNISLDGIPIGGYAIMASAGKHGKILPSGKIPILRGESKEFLIVPDENYRIASLIADGVDMTDSLEMKGDMGVFNLENVSANHQIHASFSVGKQIIETHKHQVAVYPNPANRNVTISALENIKRVDIISLSGRVLITHEGIHALDVTINTDTLRNGLYIMNILTEEGTASKKIQIMR